MKYYWLVSEINEGHANWVLFHHEPKLRLRERYKKFQCSKCGKVDELKAIKSGFEDDVVIKSRTAVTRSYEKLIVVKANVVSLLKRLKVRGVKCEPLPDGKLFVWSPVRQVEVRDPANPGIRIYRPCAACKRPREATGLPALNMLKLPKRGFDIGLPTPSPESYYTRHFFFLVGEPIVEAFQDEGIRGCKFREAG
jgi:hypothetical protein